MKKYILIFSLVFSFNANAANTCGDDLDNNCWDCGKTANDNCTARLDGTKLTITGNGYMKDYYTKTKYDWMAEDSVKRPWENTITEVEIEEGIKSIGESAFRDTKLTSVNLPASVEEIRLGGFINITTLSQVTFADNSNLKLIGSAAFNNTPLLTNFSVPQNVHIIGEDAFNRSGIESIFVPDLSFSVDGISEKGRADYFNGLNLRAFSSVKNIYCSDAVRAKCEEYFNQAEFWENGVYYPIKEKAVLNINNADGSVDTYQFFADGSAAIYRDGTLKSYKGKRIYTIDEANAVTGTTNRVSIKYK